MDEKRRKQTDLFFWFSPSFSLVETILKAAWVLRRLGVTVNTNQESFEKGVTTSQHVVHFFSHTSVSTSCFELNLKKLLLLIRDQDTLKVLLPVTFFKPFEKLEVGPILSDHVGLFCYDF